MSTSFLQFGRLHIPVFGVFAALGVMTALALSQRTARYAGLSAEAVWNASVTCVVALFAISRLLLVLFNWHSFRQYPLQLLAVPSLTTSGVLLTSLFMLGYIRYRKLPLLPLFDAMTPCAVLLWTFLSLGRLADGTHDGMPTETVLSSGVHVSGAVERVESYTLTSAFVIGFMLFQNLRSAYRAGELTGLGLFLSGFSIFFIDFDRLPSELLSDFWLDPVQIVGLAMVVIGALLLYGVAVRSFAKKRSKRDHAV